MSEALTEEKKPEESTAESTEQSTPEFAEKHIKASVEKFAEKNIKKSVEKPDKEPAAVAEADKKTISNNQTDSSQLPECPFAEHFSLSDYDYEFTQEDYILMKLRDEDLMEYLRMQERREEKTQERKELRNSRIYSILQIVIIALAIILIVWFLKDNPTVLINILYIGGILLFIWFWKHSKHTPED